MIKIKSSMSNLSKSTEVPHSSSATTLTVLFFAAARQRTQQTELAYSFTPPFTLGELKQALFSMYPSLEELAPYLRWAVNHEFVDEEQQSLSSGDEVALIPPISGG